MYPFEHTNPANPPRTLRFSGCKSVNTPIRNTRTLHQTNPFQLRQTRELSDAVIRQIHAAGEIDVANAVAAFSQRLD